MAYLEELVKVFLKMSLSNDPTDMRIPYLLPSNTLPSILARLDSRRAMPASPLSKQWLSNTAR